MDLYVLDENLNAVALIDSYTSLIWTDRFQECGDFELEMSVDLDLLDYIKQDRYLWRQDSEHVMIIEELAFNTDEEKGNIVTISGRSLESIINRRIVWGLMNVTGNLQEQVEEMFDANIINPSKPERKITNFVFEHSDDPLITRLQVDTQYTGDNIYDVVTNLCVEGEIGFKITLNNDKQFVFKFYAGIDRSYDQFLNPCVVFSPNFENLVNGEYTADRSTYKNVTLVGGEGEGTERRYTAVGNISGLSRREIFSDARDVSSDISEDVTEQFDFTMYSGQVYTASGSTASNSNFNSCRIDVSSYVGRTISVSIPKYKYKTDSASYYYASVFLDSDGTLVSTAVNWEPYSDGDLTENRGGLETYDIYIPEGVSYFYTSMYSSTAISNGIYSGETTDFKAQYSKLSNDEYITLLRQRGRETLSENRELISFEGQSEPTVMFRYGEHFFMGDVVQIADEFGHDTKARITEIITSDDETGFTTYPTFSMIGSEDNTLPDDYIELEYIQSTTAGQHIDTGYKPTTDTRLIMEISDLVRGSSNALFGVRDTNSVTAPKSFGVIMTSDDTNEIRSDYFGTTATIIPEDLTISTTVNKDKNTLFAFGLSAQNTPSVNKLECSNSIYLFCYNNAGSAEFYAGYRLYSCQIYDSEILVRNYIPCKNPSDVPGLFDTVNQQFYANDGSGTFVY